MKATDVVVAVAGTLTHSSVILLMLLQVVPINAATSPIAVEWPIIKGIEIGFAATSKMNCF